MANGSRIFVLSYTRHKSMNLAHYESNWGLSCSFVILLNPKSFKWFIFVLTYFSSLHCLFFNTIYLPLPKIKNQASCIPQKLASTIGITVDHRCKLASTIGRVFVQQEHHIASYLAKGRGKRIFGVSIQSKVFFPCFSPAQYFKS